LVTSISKIHSLRSLEDIRTALKSEGKRVVFTNGCFDLIHGGHVFLFKQAKKLGDVLIVAVNDDRSIKKIKGEGRPIFPLAERLEILESFEYIDYLIPFSEATPQKVISILLPDVLVKGEDWKKDEVVGRKEVEKAGGRVVLAPLYKGQSSTLLLEKILRSPE
jgi:D-beta-D-heptose 7-phosphate kinase/D-beta-D-heptose 1-phosphate adenosyltransferase